MTAETKQKLIECGFDWNGTMERFMNNETLLERFLKKFLEDKNFEELTAAVESKDYEKAFKASHTLLGVASNLGMMTLCEADKILLEKLRANNYEDLEQDIELVVREYHKYVAVLQEM